MSHEPSPSDAGLILAVLDGDKQRFAQLVERYEGPLLRTARSRLGRADWAEEAVQETFLCAFRWLDSYDSRYSFRTWLWTILLNQCTRIARKRNRRPKVSVWSERPESTAQQAMLEPSGGERPSDRLIARERAELLESLLDQLPANQADALRLRFFGELKYQEIADTMQCSLSTAKNRVKWGLEKLTAMISSYESAASNEPESIR